MNGFWVKLNRDSTDSSERFRAKTELAAGSVSPYPRGECRFVHGTGRQADDGLRSGFLGRDKIVTINFKEEHRKDETCALISVEKGMVADDAEGIRRSQGRDIGSISVGKELLRTGYCGLKEGAIAHAFESAIERKESTMDGESITLVDPNRLTSAPRFPTFFHLARVCSVLR